MLIDELIERAFCDGYEYAQKEFGHVVVRPGAYTTSGHGKFTTGTTYSYNQLRKMVNSGEAANLIDARNKILGRFEKLSTREIEARNKALLNNKVSLPTQETPSTLGNAPATVNKQQQMKSWWESALNSEPVHKRSSVLGSEKKAKPVLPLPGSSVTDRPKVGFAAIRDERRAKAGLREAAIQNSQKRSIPNTTSNNGWTTTGTMGGNYSYNYTK